MRRQWSLLLALRQVIEQRRRNGEQDAEAVEHLRHTSDFSCCSSRNGEQDAEPVARRSVRAVSNPGRVGTENRMRRQWSTRAACGSQTTRGCRNGEQDAEAVEPERP